MDIYMKHEGQFWFDWMFLKEQKSLVVAACQLVINYILGTGFLFILLNFRQINWQYC